jgi:lipoprotein NlpD
MLLAVFISGCNKSWVPVEDRSTYGSDYALTADGRYRVRRGDTLHAIAFNFGLDWRDVAAWNGIRSPYVIYPDQELRLSPPARSAPRQAQQRPKSSETQPPSGTTVQAAPAPRSSTAVYRDPAPEPAATPAAKPAAKGQVAGDPDTWRWPVDGRILSRFQANDPARKGIDIAGTEGQPVVATAAGEVVYSGSGLIAYGELIIIKHSERMLSAYAHNRKRLVEEGQQVKAGERIAEMGRNDRNQAMLHFEIRRDGTPQNPLDYLPSR